MDHDPMPVFTIKAKDQLSLGAITAYRYLCLAAGLDQQAAEVTKAIDEIQAWQQRNPDRLQLPDHKHVPVTPEH